MMMMMMSRKEWNVVKWKSENEFAFKRISTVIILHPTHEAYHRVESKHQEKCSNIDNDIGTCSIETSIESEWNWHLMEEVSVGTSKPLGSMKIWLN